jgi:putative PEP-CTERM system histidine kinase
MIDQLAFTLSLIVLLGYGVFSVLLVRHSRRQAQALVMALAALFTALWAACLLFGSGDLIPYWQVGLAGALRDAAWLAVTLSFLDRTPQSEKAWRILAGMSALLVLLHTALATSGIALGSIAGITFDAKLSSLLITILGCILIENLARKSSRDKFWSIKHYVIGMGTILSFQFFMQIVEFLTSEPDSAQRIALPFFYLLSLPLFALTAIRNPASKLQVHSSRQVVFHTATLVIVGIVLQGTAGAAYYLRYLGGDTGTALMIILVFTAFVAILAVIASSTLRSYLRMLISKNFFNYKYDYREEWTKFIRALSTVEETGTPIKVLRTFADLMDSPGGALWVYRENFRQFLPMAKWSLRQDLKPVASDDPILSLFQDEKVTLVDLSSASRPKEVAGWKEAFPDQWPVVPLRYRSELVAIALLSKPRAPRKLDWEDQNLVFLVALQLAVYLVHDETTQALRDARQMEEFNKRFAFLIHDMKNTIGQLDLLAKNAEKFGENPVFQRDMHVTLRNSVEKLKALLVQIRGDGTSSGDNIASAGDKNIDVVKLVKSFVDEKQDLGLHVTMNDAVSPARATIADDRTLINVLEHVVANAIEATPANSDVNVQLSAQANGVRITVTDQGPGMSQEFINERLFRPFKTTKQLGFGMGAYQARETVRKLGGEFEVLSTVGQGTRVVISLPCKFTQATRLN